jgi:hypothetical protein
LRSCFKFLGARRLKNSLLPKAIPLLIFGIVAYVAVSDYLALPVATSAVNFLAGRVLERSVGDVKPNSARRSVMFDVENSGYTLERIEQQLEKINAVKGPRTVNADREEAVKYWRCKDVEIRSVTSKSESRISFRWTGSYWPPFDRGIRYDYSKCD